MINNFFVKCKICGETFRLRYQVSDEACPLSFSCPECKTIIAGKVETVWHEGKENVEQIPWHYNLNLDNAVRINEDTAKYVFEISPEFLVSKMAKDTDKYSIGPFMRFTSLQFDFQKKIEKVSSFHQNWKLKWNDIKINLNLCHNEQYDKVLQRLSKQYDQFPIELNALISTHHELVSFVNKLLPKGVLFKYSKLFKHISYLQKTRTNEFNSILSIFNELSIKDLERRTIQIVKTFLDMFPLFVPVFNSLEIEDKKSFAISTITFEGIKTFYQDSYELLLSYIPLIIALNNIDTRGKINCFKNREIDFNDKINSYNSKYKMYTDLIDKTEYFSWMLGNDLFNHVRNSIGHFNYKEDSLAQKITFIDKEKTEIRYLTEIADSCVRMFFSLINVMELNYSLMKLHYIINLSKN